MSLPVLSVEEEQKEEDRDRVRRVRKPVASTILILKAYVDSHLH